MQCNEISPKYLPDTIDKSDYDYNLHAPSLLDMAKI